MSASTDLDTAIAYDALPPTQPITLPMRDEFGAYFPEWHSEHSAS